jgi:hypothetical protein
MFRIRTARLTQLAAVLAAIAIPAAAQTGSPNFIVGYSLQPLNNAVTLTNGATITFPKTQVGATASGTLIIGNLGTAAGAVTSVVVTGSAFNTQSLPLLPVTVGAGAQMTVPLIYSPSTVGADSGTLQIVAGGQTFTANLAGMGIAAQLQFQVTQNGQTISVDPLGTVPIPDTPLGSTSTISITFTNIGNTTVSITNIAVSGTGYQLAGVPPLPLNVLAGGSASMTFTFTPTQPGTSSGALTIGPAVFTLAGRALGALYRYSFSLAGTASSVSPGGTVFFPQAEVGRGSSATFSIMNSGTASGSIAGIYVGGGNSSFTLGSLPGFPLTLAPGQAASFLITFTPAAAGGSTSVLNIDGAQFTLAGSASSPPDLPAWSITGASGTLTPLQQVSVGLSLAAPYPLAISGTLTMNVLPQGFSADPAIQFSTGGKTVAFTIPANSTTATFANGATSVKLQTGSTAGTITLTPAFQTLAGATLTGGSGTPVVLSVPATVPVVVGAQIVSQSATSLAFAVTGVANTQTLNHLDFKFTPASGYSVKNSTVSIPVSAAATAFFGSAAAQNFGGQFVATVPFSFNVGSTVTSAVSLMQSVVITATSDQGTSAPLTLNLQ